MIGIKRIGTYLPKARTSNFERMKKFGMTESLVREKIGFFMRSKLEVRAFGK
jgi:hypothetical protein